jgi:hypothetical protein
MYDFKAERADEFNAQAGEAIIIIAQSNPEWLVAKPIGRLGHPGLIPVSFVEIRDMATDKPIENPEEAIRKAGVPKVEEWKRRVAEYNSSGIALGKFEGPGSPGSPGASSSSQQPQSLANAMDRMSLQQNGKNPAPNGVSCREYGGCLRRLESCLTLLRFIAAEQPKWPSNQPGTVHSTSSAEPRPRRLLTTSLPHLSSHSQILFR